MGAQEERGIGEVDQAGQVKGKLVGLVEHLQALDHVSALHQNATRLFDSLNDAKPAEHPTRGMDWETSRVTRKEREGEKRRYRK